MCAYICILSLLHVHTLMDRCVFPLQEQLTTTAVPRSFAPEVCQTFKLALPLGEEGQEGGRLACQLMHATLLVEVWHQTQQEEMEAISNCGDVAVVLRRKCQRSSQDVLLGVAHVPLMNLLSCTGTLPHMLCFSSYALHLVADIICTCFLSLQYMRC